MKSQKRAKNKTKNSNIRSPLIMNKMKYFIYRIVSIITDCVMIILLHTAPAVYYYYPVKINYITYVETGQLSTWPFVLMLVASMSGEGALLYIRLRQDGTDIDDVKKILVKFIPTNIVIIASIVLIIYSLFV